MVLGTHLGTRRPRPPAEKSADSAMIGVLNRPYELRAHVRGALNQRRVTRYLAENCDEQPQNHVAGAALASATI